MFMLENCTLVLIKHLFIKYYHAKDNKFIAVKVNGVAKLH